MKKYIYKGTVMAKLDFVFVGFNLVTSSLKKIEDRIEDESRILFKIGVLNYIMGGEG